MTEDRIFACDYCGAMYYRVHEPGRCGSCRRYRKGGPGTVPPNDRTTFDDVTEDIA